MTMIASAPDTETANTWVASGWAEKGDLLLHKRLQTVVKVTGSTPTKYSYVDEDGREWRMAFGGFEAAPVGATFSGPDVAPSEAKRAEREALAREFHVGDTVEFVKDKDRRDCPGTYLITKRTSPTRFKLQQVGGSIGVTSPASLIRKVEG